MKIKRKELLEIFCKTYGCTEVAEVEKCIESGACAEFMRFKKDLKKIKQEKSIYVKSAKDIFRLAIERDADIMIDKDAKGISIRFKNTILLFANSMFQSCGKKLDSNYQDENKYTFHPDWTERRIHE